MGYEAAENKWMAKIAQLQAEYNARAAAAAQRFNEELKKKTSEAMAASDRFHQEKQEHEDTRASLTKRIDAIANSSTHTFSPAFVRVWNDAVGAVATRSGATKGANSASTYPVSRSGKASGAGFQGKVTEADILRWISYYGRRSKDIESQLRGLIDIVKEGGK